MPHRPCEVTTRGDARPPETPVCWRAAVLGRRIAVQSHRHSPRFQGRSGDLSIISSCSISLLKAGFLECGGVATTFLQRVPAIASKRTVQQSPWRMIKSAFDVTLPLTLIPRHANKTVDQLTPENWLNTRQTQVPCRVIIDVAHRVYLRHLRQLHQSSVKGGARRERLPSSFSPTRRSPGSDGPLSAFSFPVSGLVAPTTTHVHPAHAALRFSFPVPSVAELTAP
jgi:hypothetical protein